MLGSLRGWREGCPHLLSASDGEFVAIVLFLHDGSKDAAIRASSLSVIGVTTGSKIICAFAGAARTDGETLSGGPAGWSTACDQQP